MKLRNVLTHPAVIIPLALSATAVEAGSSAVLAASLENPTYPIPGDACFSPVVKSNVLVDPEADLFWQTYIGNGASGAVARGIIPSDAYGVVASFKSPESNDWVQNRSRLLKASAGAVAIRYALGPDPVVFGAQVAAPKGSETCRTAPNLSFTPEGPAEYDKSIGQEPWPQPGKLLYNFFFR
jgi:hypothetical protein